MNRYLVEKYQSKHIFLLLFLFVILFSSACSSSKKLQKQRVDKVVETAKTYRGTPYRFGGTTRAGIDCSALIVHAFASANIQMPRTTAEQSKLGKKVNAGNLQKGDLVFFATGKKKRAVSHAGIVTDKSRGQVIFIHSSTSLGVTEDALDNSYWSKAFLFGRRIL